MSLDSIIEAKIDRIVRYTIAKKVRQLMWCDEPKEIPNSETEEQREEREENETEEMLKNTKCESKYKKSIFNSWYQIPSFETLNNNPDPFTKDFTIAKRKYWDKLPINVRSKRSISGNLFVKFLMRYVDYQRFHKTTPFHETIYRKYFDTFDKDLQTCGSIYLQIFEYIDDEIFQVHWTIPKRAMTPKIEKIYNDINIYKIPNFMAYDIGDDMFQISYEANNNQNFSGEGVEIFMYDILLEYLNNCKSEVIFIQTGVFEEYNDSNKNTEHAIGTIVQKHKSFYDIMIVDPHGNNNAMINKFIKNINFGQKAIRKNLFRLYQMEASCPDNFQSTWKDDVGYCVIYTYMWFDCVMNVIYNIQKYNQKKENSSLQIENVPIIAWVQKISHYLNQIDDIVQIIYHPFDGEGIFEQTYKTKAEIIYRFTLQLIEDYRKFFPDGVAKLENFMKTDLQKQHKDRTRALKENGYYEQIYGYGKYFDDLDLNTNVSYSNLEGFLYDKNGGFFDGSDRSYSTDDDSFNIDNERHVEDIILKRFAGSKYNQYCYSDSDCEHDRIGMVCDSSEESDSGVCIPTRKTTMTMCDHNSECISNSCQNGICRMKRNQNDKLIDVKDYVENLKEIQRIHRIESNSLDSKIDKLGKSFLHFGLSEKLKKRKQQYSLDYLENPEETAEKKKWTERNWDVYFNHKPENEVTIESINKFNDAYDEHKRRREDKQKEIYPQTKKLKPS
jgi:hypothetical protein